jgi:thymidylate synthase (FAD)
VKVTLIGTTVFMNERAREGTDGEWREPVVGEDGEWLVTHSELLVELAGRACYQSWRRPNPSTAANDAYLKHILDVGHYSVLEHATATFYVTGVSRSLTHELVRHRHLSFSQLSQRFVDEDRENGYVVPPDVTGIENEHSRQLALQIIHDVDEMTRTAYADLVQILTETGLSRKRVRQAARAVLPNMTETKLVVTGNHRAWREVITLRNSPAADEEIQELARELLRQLKVVAPSIYQDM